LPANEQAFIFAAVAMKIEKDKKEAEKQQKAAKSRRRR